MAEINSGYSKDDKETEKNVYPSIHSESNELKFNLIHEPKIDIPIPEFGIPGSIGIDPNSIKNLSESKNQNLNYDKLLINNGKVSISIGCIVMVLDPLIPAIYLYFYSLFPAGVFMFLSGILSMLSTKNNRRSFIISSLTFNIFAFCLVFVGYSLGIFIAKNAFADNFSYFYIYSNLTCRFNILCYPTLEFYKDGIKGLTMFHAVLGSVLMVWLIWDTSVKCVKLTQRKP